MYSANLKSVHS